MSAQLDKILEAVTGIHVRMDRFEIEQKMLRHEMNERFSEMDRRFDDVAKEFSVVHEKFAEVDRRFDEMDRRFVEVDQRFDDVTVEFGIMHLKFAETDKRFDGVTAEFGSIHGKFEEIKQIISDAQVKNLESDNLILREIGQLREEVRYAIDTSHENREQIHRLKNRLG
ncbi:hypothetical protein [Aneurinibacillus aneurinilyticus]|jgi:uncharacterized coiled-coil DUF342 family protein|uniref:t-SNARE coiled-coil homology domain-containing protein n=1 Tax=Aneurinibacillus aneurinilyticus TaxID=1391 RepID=A0A848D050_ANEAE|nr:hypothetical protein [Aneurinibacillus aneurinilyticus]NMF00552.1 hypothetical protein [Aneurinibacillus aneurinilyticus]